MPVMTPNSGALRIAVLFWFFFQSTGGLYVYYVTWFLITD